MAAPWPKDAPEDFPEHVRVGRRNVRVKYVDPDDPAMKDDGHLLGCAEYHKDLITISLGQSVNCMRNTVLHEYVHLAYAHHGIGGSDPDHDEEERLVCWVTDIILELAESGWLKTNF